MTQGHGLPEVVQPTECEVEKEGAFCERQTRARVVWHDSCLLAVDLL